MTTAQKSLASNITKGQVWNRKCRYYEACFATGSQSPLGDLHNLN